MEFMYTSKGQEVTVKVVKFGSLLKARFYMNKEEVGYKTESSMADLMAYTFYTRPADALIVSA